MASTKRSDFLLDQPYLRAKYDKLTQSQVRNEQLYQNHMALMDKWHAEAQEKAKTKLRTPRGRVPDRPDERTGNAGHLRKPGRASGTAGKSLDQSHADANLKSTTHGRAKEKVSRHKASAKDASRAAQAADEGKGAQANGEGEQAKESGKEVNHVKTKGKSRKHGRRKQGKAKEKHGGSILEHSLDGGAGEGFTREKAQDESGDSLQQDAKGRVSCSFCGSAKHNVRACPLEPPADFLEKG